MLFCVTCYMGRGILLSSAPLGWPSWPRNVLGILRGAERISLLGFTEGYFQGLIKTLLENHALLFTEVLLLFQVPPQVHLERRSQATYCCIKPETWKDLSAKSSHSTCKRS